MAYYGVDPSRLGLDSAGAAGNEDLFLKVFSGEVLTTFEENNLMMPLHRVRTINSGKSAQFPVTGVASAVYHTPGDSLFADEAADGNTYASTMNHSEKVISIDGVLTSSAFIADIDEAKNHYEVRSIYSTEIGRQLAYAADKNLIRCLVAASETNLDRFGTSAASTAAQIASPYLGGKILVDGSAADANGVTEITGGGDNDGTVEGSDWIQALFTMAELMDKKNVPAEGRHAVLPPDEYYKLVNENQDAINRDYNPEGNGSIAAGEIVSVAGVRILKSNHIPQTDESAATNVHNSSLINNDPFAGAGAGYGGYDFSECIGVGFQTEGLGTVKLLDLAMESEYYMERLGTMLMARYAMGHGVLREECCYSFSNET
jgi:hypothetical protein